MGKIILAVLSSIAWLYYLQPLSWQRFWGRALGALLRVFGLRSQVVLQNLNIAFPGDDPSQQLLKQRVFKESYDHLGHLVFEILLLLGPMKKYCLKYVDLEGAENWKAAKEKGQGIIVLSSHLGNWEVSGARGSVVGMEVMFVTKHLKPEWLHQAIEKGRKKCNVDATYEPRTFRDVLARLRRNMTVGIVLDQYAGPPVGVRVPLFGVPVGTHSLVAMVAKRTGATVLPVHSHRKPNGRILVKIEPPVDWISHSDPQEELGLNTARFAQILEGQIRANPEQWLWIHKRFKGDLSPLRKGEWSQGRSRQS